VVETRQTTSAHQYEQLLVNAIMQRWSDLLERKSTPPRPKGEVVVSFVLHNNGTVGEVKIAQSTIADLSCERLCCQAVQDVAPFPVVPEHLRDEFGNGHEVRFTFMF